LAENVLAHASPKPELAPVMQMIFFTLRYFLLRKD
jgi:hypothetical protein